MSKRRGNEYKRPEWYSESLISPMEDIMLTILDSNTSSEERANLRNAFDETVAAFAPNQETLDKIDMTDFIVKNEKTNYETPTIILGPKGYKSQKEKLPIVYFVHGGGLCIYDYKTELINMIKIALKQNCVVIGPGYPKAPEHKYTDTMSSLESVVDWMITIENANEHNYTTDKAIVRGLSTGGHLAAALSHKLKVRNKENNDANGFQFIGQVLIYPVLDDRPMYECSKLTSFFWTPMLGRASAKAWLGDEYCSPMLPEWAYPARAEDYTGLPPTFLHCAENDHDRESCMKYAQNLYEAGIFCDLMVWGGAVHASGMMGNQDVVSKRLKRIIHEQIEDSFRGGLVRDINRNDNSAVC